jgi:hypothetical protein
MLGSNFQLKLHLLSWGLVHTHNWLFQNKLENGKNKTEGICALPKAKPEETVNWSSLFRSVSPLMVGQQNLTFKANFNSKQLVS